MMKKLVPWLPFPLKQQNKKWTVTYNTHGLQVADSL
jgi:hypothetical protein